MTSRNVKITWRHPERSRFSGGARDLPCDAFASFRVVAFSTVEKRTLDKAKLDQVAFDQVAFGKGTHGKGTTSVVPYSAAMNAALAAGVRFFPSLERGRRS